MTASTEPTFVDETLELGADPARRDLGVVHGWLAGQTHMVGHLLHHPQLAGLRRFVLHSRDARGLYERLGFTALPAPELWMERPASVPATHAVVA